MASIGEDGGDDKYERPSRVDWNGHNGRMNRTLQDSTKHGSSLRGTNLCSLMKTKEYSIVCGIEVQNWTKYELRKPFTTVKSGYVSSPPISIRPGQKEAMITHKHGYTMTGSSGIVSWLIKNNCKRVVVMWSSPYFSTNTLAVGLTDGIQTQKESWFDTINKRHDDGNMKYIYQLYNKTCNEIMVEDDTFQVLGSMGTSSKPEIKITVRPKNMQDLSISAEKLIIGTRQGTSS